MLAGSITILMSGCNSEPPVAEAKVRAKPRRTSPTSQLPGATMEAAPETHPTATSSGVPTALAAAVPMSSPTAPVAPVLPKPVKRIDGAVVENLGPCHGRGIAGEANINGRKEYICGDGTRAYLNDTGYYGKNSRYSRRRGSGGYSTYPPQRRVVTYVP